MSIVVKHSPDLSAMGELSYQSGKGQYNQWLAQFKQQQENAKTQALLGGLGVGSRLGLGIAGMRSRERMQGQRLAAASQKSVETMQQNKQWAEVQAGPLFDAAALRWPLQPMRWKEVQNWDKKEQEGLLKWASGVRGTQRARELKEGDTTLSGDISGQISEGSHLSQGKDRYQKGRDSIDRALKMKTISQPMAQQLHQRLKENQRIFGNKAVRTQTPQERTAANADTRQFPGGKKIYGHYDEKGAWQEDYSPPSEAERKTIQIERLGTITKAIPVLNESINEIKESLKGEPIADSDGVPAGASGWTPTYEPLDPEDKEHLQQQLRLLRTARTNAITSLGDIDSGEKDNLPFLTQNWVSRIEQNPSLTPSQKNFYIMLQKSNPSEYIFDRPDLKHFRMGAWDTGDPSRVYGSFGEFAGERGADTFRPRTFADEQPPDDPPQPPMPQQQTPFDTGMQPLPGQVQWGPGPETLPAQDTREGGPPPGGSPPGGSPPGGLPPLTHAERTNQALDVPGRLQGMGPDPAAQRLDDMKLYEASQGARKVALKMAHGEHIRVESSKQKKVRATPGSATARRGEKTDRKVVLGDVQALTPRPERLGKAGIGFEVELERLYNGFPRLDDRSSVRFVQSMLRKYDYDLQKIRSQASAHEQAAWHDAMKKVKQLKDASKRRR